MSDKYWIEAMKYQENVRLFCSLYRKKSQKGEFSSAREVDTLFRIALAEHPVTPLYLSRNMEINKSIVSRIIDKLCAKNMVQKQFDQNDKRSYSLTITPEGIEELERAYREYVDPIRTLQNKMKSENFLQFMQLILEANRLLADSKEEE